MQCGNIFGKAKLFVASVTTQQSWRLSDQVPQRIRRRCILCDAYSFTALYQLVLAPQHLQGRYNAAVDHLSCDALSSFLHLIPNALTEPTVLPDRLIRALVHQQPDWTSPARRATFLSILPMVSQPPLKRTYRSGENRYMRFCSDIVMQTLCL